MATVAYLRTSTDRQSELIQREAIERSGVTIDRWFIDHGVSGRKASRPELDAMRQWSREGDAVLVHSLSRLGRSTLDLLTLLRDFEARGVAVRSLTESVDTSTPMGRLVVTVLAAVAEMEVDVTRQRVLSGLAAAKAHGRVGGRPRTPEDRLVRLRELVRRGVPVAEAGVSRSVAYDAVSGLRGSVSR